MPYASAEDQRDAQRRHYIANKPAYLARARAKQSETRAAILALVLAYLLTHPCIDCGEADPVVLEFDHRDAAQKQFSISASLKGNKASVDKVREEIDKCDVRCANCHRRRTAKQFGWRNKIQ